MSPVISAVLLAAVVVAHSAAHAQSSMLRVTCEGADIGAEVSINGRFKGECPLDAKVGAGTVKLRLVKKTDSLHEQVFEQDVRIGDGVVKRIDVVLAAPRLVSESSGHEKKTLPGKSAESKRRPGQTDTAVALATTPSRPAISLGISEDIWKIIEASEAYRKLPQPRTSKVVFQGKEEMEYTGSKSKSLPNPGAKSISTTRVIAPVGDKCTVTVTDSTTEGKSGGANESYHCGSIWLGFVSGGKPSFVISRIDELKGSLFPMRVGARLTISYQMAYIEDRKYDSTNAFDCAVVGRLAAQELDSRLAGAAWKVHCKSSHNSSQERETDDYYLEDQAVMLSTIGAYDTSKNAHVLPSAGTRTLIEAEGDYGSRNITSYATYNWEVGGAYEMPAPIAPPTIAAASNDGRRPAAGRDGPGQREQPRRAELADAGAQAEKPASDGSDLLGAILGGLASGLVDHAAAQINSAAAGTGGADGVAMGVLGSVTAQLARETKDQVARDRAGNGQADTSQEPAGSSLVNSLAGAMINQTNNVTASALAGDGHTGMAALVGNMNSAMLSSLQGSGSTGGGGSGAAASPKASAGSARIFVVSRSTREEACEVSKRMTKQDGQEITGTCSCNTLFNSNNCRAEVVGPKGAAATPGQLAAAKECATPSKQNEYGYRSTGNAQLDKGCSLVAFDVCLAKSAGVSTYAQEANIQCSILRRTMKVAGGGTICELPCAAAAKLPVADPCQYLKNCTR